MTFDTTPSFTSLSEACSSARLSPSAFATGAIASSLSSSDSSRFGREGWCGPYPILAPLGLAELKRIRYEIVDRYFTSPAEISLVTSSNAFDKRPWFKSLHAHVPAIHDVVTHPSIVGRVVSLLGIDVIAWGAFIKLLGAKAGHRWHRDVEHLQGNGVTVYLGVSHLSHLSTLKVVTRTHRLAQSPQDRAVESDADALREAAREVPDPKLVRMPVVDGSCVLFDGKLWHGSQNNDTHDRLALIIQYSRPDVEIRVPLSWRTDVTWHSTPPPCLLVSGKDKWNRNRIVRPQF